MDVELEDLRLQVERLLAAALASDERHADELRQRNEYQADSDERHADELRRRDQYQAASDERHAEELRERDEYLADTDERHAEELRQRDKYQVASDERHADELRQRDRNHAGDVERREQRHADELRQHSDQHELDAANLRKALESRDVIGQAKGIIMATMQCTADEAFVLLKRQSQAENVKVVDIAAELADRTARRAHRGAKDD